MYAGQYIQLKGGPTLSEGNDVLPRNFSWLEPDKVAGSARPETEGELAALKRAGIEAIVSLSGTPLIPEIVKKVGFEYLHSHISSEMGYAAIVMQLEQIISFIEEENRRSKPVLVHCGEGMGRTGTVLAAYLVHKGRNADEAIKEVRTRRPGSIQSLEQENAVRQYEKRLRA